MPRRPHTVIHRYTVPFQPSLCHAPVLLFLTLSGMDRIHHRRSAETSEGSGEWVGEVGKEDFAAHGLVAVVGSASAADSDAVGWPEDLWRRALLHALPTNPHPLSHRSSSPRPHPPPPPLPHPLAPLKPISGCLQDEQDAGVHQLPDARDDPGRAPNRGQGLTLFHLSAQLERLYVIGGARRGRVARVKGVLGAV